MRFLLYSFAILLPFLVGCKESEDPTPDYVAGKIWYRTYQPGDDDYMIFSTTDPNIRWHSDGFRLNADGSFLEYGLDAVYTPEVHPGTWRSEGTQIYRITFRDQARQGYLLRIAKPTNDQLLARREY